MKARPPAPHDLVWLADPPRSLGRDGLPDWVSLEALSVMPAVVRRDGRRAAAIPSCAIPIGLRGRSRAERFGTWIAPSAVGRVVTPMEIAAGRQWRERPELASLPAIRALDGAADALDGEGLQWGPTGSAGFSVACPVNALHADSDLDLVVYAPSPLPRTHFDLLAGLQAAAPARIDIQVDTPFGGFAFLEMLRRGPGSRVLLKTAHGPRMCADPWRPAP